MLLEVLVERAVHDEGRDKEKVAKCLQNAQARHDVGMTKLAPHFPFAQCPLIQINAISSSVYFSGRSTHSTLICRVLFTPTQAKTLQRYGAYVRMIQG